MLQQILDILSREYMDFLLVGLFLAVFIYSFRKNQRRRGAAAPLAAMEHSSASEVPIHAMEHRHDDYRSPSDLPHTSIAEVNPATGLMMNGGIGGVDTAGNSYGSSSNGT